MINIVLQFDSTRIDQTSELKLDTASRSVGVDLGQEYGVNKIELHPSQASTRVRQQDISVYLSSDNGTSTSATSGYQLVTGWRLATNSDGSMLITFSKIQTARYVKVNTIWDDRDLDNESVDSYATFSNKAIDLVKVWVLTPYQTRNYSYDAIGNIDALNKDGVSQSYDYYRNASGKPLNLIKNDGQWYYDYDKAGNRILKAKAISSGALGSVAPDASKEYWVYSWDLYNRLSTATQTVDGSTKTVSYTYDAENFRVQRTDSTGTVVYGYDRNAALAYEKNLTTGLTRTITYANGLIVGWKDTDSSGTSTKYYAVTDNLGSVTHITDSSGKILWQSEYTPYGEVAGAEGSIDFDGMYTGQDIDHFTGLTYHWNRWRSEDGTRFVSEDPAQDGMIAYNPMQRRYLTTDLLAGDGDMLSGTGVQNAFGASVQGVAKSVTMQPGMQANGYITFSGASVDSPVSNPESGLVQSSLNFYYYVHASPEGATDAFGLKPIKDQPSESLKGSDYSALRSYLNPNAINERFYQSEKALVGTPYVWGGKNAAKDGGLDCSGAVRTGLNENGADLPIMNADTFTKKYTSPITGDSAPGDVRVLDYDSDGNYEHIQVLGNNERVNASGDKTNTIDNPGSIDLLTTPLPSTGEIRRIDYDALPGLANTAEAQ